MIDSWAKDLDLPKAYKEGAQARHEPQKLMNERQKEIFENAIKGVESKYAEPNAQQSLQKAITENKYLGREKEAGIKQKEAMAQLPYGGMVTGDLMQSLMTENILNNPNIPQATKDRVKRDRDSLVRQREMGNTPMSAKLREDEVRISNDPNMTEDEKAEAIALNRAANRRGSTTESSQMMATRADITGMGFDELMKPEVLTALSQYSGYKGAAEKLSDNIEKRLTRKTPERLLAYDDAQTIAFNTAKNLRAAIKDSIDPRVGKEYLDKLDPANLDRNPDEVIRILEAGRRFFEKESKAIYRNAGRVQKKEQKEEKSQFIKPGAKIDPTIWKEM